ncbi:MAG: acyltransferase [Myxococcota bacterium]|jgi:peptidoglycan/LPS O-acetylase OafA/YrhL|nr:acyltransferase [Myxococcota bacterium]
MSQQPGSGDLKRVVALDGLRGLAAIAVVVGHTIGALRSPPGIAAPSVILFFVLSGYCLSTSALRGDRAVDRVQFFIRRVFRIHPPFVFALLFAWVVSLSAHTAPCCDGLSRWILHFNQVALSVPELFGFLFFPGTADNLMPIGWSLEVEMVFSILFPFMLWLTREGHWSVPLGLALFALFQYSTPYNGQVYAIHFVVGILIFETGGRLRGLAQRAPVGLSLAVALFATYFTAVGVGVVPRDWNVLLWFGPLRLQPWTLLSLAISSSAFTIGAIHLPWLRNALEWRPVRFLGRISYSVYLLHFTVLLLCLRLVGERQSDLQVAVFVVAVVGVTVALSAAMYRFIELPSIRLGNAVCVRVAGRAHSQERLARVADQS